MADISKIKTLNGTVYDIKDVTARSSIPAAATSAPKMDGSAVVGSSAKYAREDHCHPVDTSRAAASHTHQSIDIIQGNGAVSGGLDPLTQTMIGSGVSNKSFALPAAAIQIEYSTNAGSTWIDYGASDTQKRALFAETRSFSAYLGKNTAKASNTVNNWLRITIEPTDRYVSFNGLYIWMSTSGNTVTVDLERSTIGAKNTFTTVFTGQSISGWSGNNIRYFSGGSFGGSSTQTSNYYKYRLTFKQTAVNTNYGSASIIDIRFLGGNVWASPNNMVSKNHLYTWDVNLNATFPAQVNATSFNGHTVNADVPANAKFTDTTYESKAAASGGTAVSLVTTGEKYTWNNKGSGTITGIKMNGTSKGTSGVVDLGTVITAVTASSTNGNIKINGTETTVYTHPGSGTNPHGTTKSDVGLGNVGNFKAVSTVASQGLTNTEKSNARANIDAGTSSLTLGTSSSTAYRGDYGNSAYTHAVTNKGKAFSSGLYKITTNSEGHVTAATAVAKTDITALGIPGSDTNTTYTANTSKLVTTTVPNVTSAGSAPTLGTPIPADDITAWTTNTPTAFEIIGEKLKITAGKAATLSYTAKSIPNVTSAGSAPTLGTAITVATGSLASSGSGGTVATGITAS